MGNKNKKSMLSTRIASKICHHEKTYCHSERSEESLIQYLYIKMRFFASLRMTTVLNTLPQSTMCNNVDKSKIYHIHGYNVDNPPIYPILSTIYPHKINFCNLLKRENVI